MDAVADTQGKEADCFTEYTASHLPALSIPTCQSADRRDQSDPARLGELLCDGSLQSVFRVHP